MGTGVFFSKKAGTQSTLISMLFTERLRSSSNTLAQDRRGTHTISETHENRTTYPAPPPRLNLRLQRCVKNPQHDTMPEVVHRNMPKVTSQGLLPTRSPRSATRRLGRSSNEVELQGPANCCRRTCWHGQQDSTPHTHSPPGHHATHKHWGLPGTDCHNKPPRPLLRGSVGRSGGHSHLEFSPMFTSFQPKPRAAVGVAG